MGGDGLPDDQFNNNVIQALPEHFVDLSEEPNDPIIFAETKPVGAIDSLIPLTIIPLTNHEGYMPIQNVLTNVYFSIGEKLIGGWARYRFNFSAMSAYPTLTGANFIDDLGDFSDLTAGIYDMFIEYDGDQVNYWFRFIQAV